MKHLIWILALSWGTIANAQQIPLADAHIHYSHDAWNVFPPEIAVGLLKEAGLKHAFISSSSDDGTQKLYEAAPDIVVPVLRPYARRGQLSTWLSDDTVLPRMEARIAANTYAGLGEFHVYGDNVFLPIMQGMIALAKEHDLFLHAHSDAAAVDNIFTSYPDARVLWAHSGFGGPEEVAVMLEKHPKLWADLALRSGHANQGKVEENWRTLFEQFPDRIMLGTDTYTPERWPFVVAHADWSREWLSTLPKDLAEKLAYKNAAALIEGWND